MNPDEYPVGEYPALPTGFFVFLDPYPEYRQRHIYGVMTSAEFWKAIS